MARRFTIIFLALTLSLPAMAKAKKKAADDDADSETAPPCQLVRLEHTVRDNVFTFSYEIRDEQNLVLSSFPGENTASASTALERLQKAGICGKVKLVRRDDFNLPE